jgi:hypothetical protein
MTDNRTTMVARESDLDRLNKIQRYVHSDTNTPYYRTLDLLMDYFISREIDGDTIEVST